QTANNTRQIYEIKSPPSDGRKLVLNQANYYDGGTINPSSTGSVDFVADGTTYSNLVTYKYVTSGQSEGMLWRVLDWTGNNGTQYDYGSLSFSNNTTAAVDDSGDSIKIALISKITSGTPFAVTATDSRYDDDNYSPGRYFAKSQYFREPDSSNWRKSFEIDHVNYTVADESG